MIVGFNFAKVGRKPDLPLCLGGMILFYFVIPDLISVSSIEPMRNQRAGHYMASLPGYSLMASLGDYPTASCRFPESLFIYYLGILVSSNYRNMINREYYVIPPENGFTDLHFY